MNGLYQSLVLLAIYLFIGCKAVKQQQSEQTKDNAIITSMFLKDLEIRAQDAKTDTVNLEQYDKIHRNRIFEMLANDQVKTPMDKYKAALILQHTAAKICDGQLTSLSSENFLLAFQLSSAALNELQSQNDSVTIKKENIPRMVALNYDRYLLFSFGYQKYGTQFVFDDVTGEMLLAPIDTSLSNDEERKKYQVEPLSKLLTQYKMKAMPK